MTQENTTQHLDKADKAEQQDQKRSLDRLVRMAFIGTHLIEFIRKCHHSKANPKIALDGMKVFNEKQNEEDGFKPFPFGCFWNWINEPTETNYLALGESLGIDFKEADEKMEAEAKK